MSANYSSKAVQGAYSKIAWAYDAWGCLTETKAARQALKMAGVQPGMNLLEVAVGTGRFFEELVKQNPDGMNIGMDLSSHMLKRARRRLRKFSKYHLVRGSALQLPFADHQFNLIVCNYMMDLLPEEEFATVIREFKRVLQSPARVVVSYMAPGTKSVHRFWRWLAKAFPQLLTGCRPVSLQSDFADAGFQKIQIRKVSQNTFPSEVLKAEI